jgi:hypothetical protein
MAENKKGFILYADQKELFDQLPNEKAGELIKHIFEYVNDENPQTNDLILKLAFTPIKQQFKRDLDKWETTKKGRSKAGKASVEARKKKKQQESTNLTFVKSVQQESTNLTVNDNVNVNVNDNVKVTVKVKDKVINKNTLDKRKLKFAESLEIHLDTFGKDLLNNFFHYWTEHNDEGKKMRFEYAKNQPFNVKRRLTSWQSRNKENANFKGNKKRGEGVDAEYMNELKTRLYGNK